MASVVHQGDKHIVDCPHASTHEFEDPDHAQLFADILNEHDPHKAQRMITDMSQRFSRSKARVIPRDNRH